MKKVVVKVGSSVIAPQGVLDAALIARLTADFLAAEKMGYKVLLVSSGAIAGGLNKLKFKRRPQDIHSLMAISSLGQILLMDIYREKFKKHKKLCAQILLTWDDFDNRTRFLNARNTIDKLLSMGIIPIINENDAIAYDEIRFGENDRLSALVSDLSGAQTLIILSDVAGLIENGQVVKVVRQVGADNFRWVKPRQKGFTAGGMTSKLAAAKIAASAGIKTVIACGRTTKVVERILAGEDIGTVFLPSDKACQARKRWIAFSKKIKGKVYIDDGARCALLQRGKSLLSVGIIKVEGDFKAKDAVQVLDKEGIACGCGLINYSSEGLGNLGQKKFEKEVIHRDNFVRTFDT